MASDIVIPKLGMTMASAKLAAWKAAEGEWITEGQPVMVIETEKVTQDVEALADGFLHILAAPGAVAQVGEAVGQLAADEAELKALQAAAPAPEGLAAAPAAAPSAGEPAAPAAPGGRVKITPLAKKIARENGLDYRRLTGSGPGGRIKRADVERALKEGPPPAAEAPAAQSAAAWPGEVIEGKRVKDSLPLSGIRAVIAEHMHKSLQNSAQLSAMGEFDVAELVRLRQSLIAHQEMIGARISYTDLLVYIVARALKKNPLINSSVVGDQIKLWEDINIGVAVSLPMQKYDAGLIVPVIHDADKLSLTEISLRLKDLRRRCQEGTIGLEDLGGGTFTISNVGGFGQGYVFTTPIINQPQAAILGVGAILDRPVVQPDGQIGVGKLMNFSLTFDHRAINGAPIGLFLGTIQEMIKTPGLLLA
ncbi:catalytic domain of components of various dehydrogenase complexes [Desulfarculus baarsii DSM 2075]|uniref:Dihydrolipoamide acetyltransferase component of pyruvate dehydrogenase complex n=1 Tax=Desulfarculus baarsii (strain ATCC 33931 / DSM 2075 / LMG 7858 / VKM B-1802 / 2st14) TaxID=644282 RepID=E1QKX4_DESB2|nr:dihydrolipoamide acetyltransferase family protein [Desulfarculus baarsii]ADK86333.1 catalytic domain of components of various dehydrogenase complexes [Desulfarculus baarsii DSM 2075]